MNIVAVEKDSAIEVVRSEKVTQTVLARTAEGGIE
jgi:hypothetical protein